MTSRPRRWRRVRWTGHSLEAWNSSIFPGSLMVYAGDLLERLDGRRVDRRLSGEALVRVDLDGSTSGEVEVFDMGERIHAVEQGPDGAVRVLEDGGSGRLLRRRQRSDLRDGP